MLNRPHRSKSYIEQEDLPKSRVGKVDRNTLKQMRHAGSLYQTMKARPA